ncbi:MAG TPA: ThiF family adenylyltransferase [Humisphaera sp.]
MHDTPIDLLQLRADFLVVPRGPHEVYLYAEGATSVHLQCDDVDLPALCSALARGSTAADVRRAAVAGRPGSAASAADEVVAKLRAAGALQREVAAPPGLSTAELERFGTHLAYFSRFETPAASRYDMLQRVRGAHVLLVGLGGLGSAALAYLVAAGVGRVTGVDADLVEPRNLGRQTFFAERDVGRKKVEAARDAVARLTAHTAFAGVDRQVGSAADVEALVRSGGGADLMVQAADRPIWDLTRWMAKAAISTGVPVLHASYLGVGPLFVPGRSACPACMLPRVESQIRDAQEIVEFYRRVEEQGVPRSVLPTSLGQFGVFMAHEAVTHLAGAGTPRTVNAVLRLYINGDPSTVLDGLPPDPRCAVCHGEGGRRRDILGTAHAAVPQAV